MKVSMVCLSLAATCGYARLASSQDFSGERGVPPARVGFQLGLRTGLAIPLGKADGDPRDAMSDVFSPQVPLLVEIGGKPIPQLFLGGYLGLGFGGTAGALRDSCERTSTTCFTLGARFGAEVQYHITPAARANPWVGYGIGYESMGVIFSEGSRTGSLSYNGFEYGHFMGGVDFRLTRVFGLGPFVDFAIGEYRRSRYEQEGDVTIEGDIVEKAMHEWLTIGLRTVFFP